MGEMVAIYFVLGGTVSPILNTSPQTILNPMLLGQPISVNMELSYAGSLDGTLPGPAVYFLGVMLFLMVGIANIAIRMVLARSNKTTEPQK